MFERILLAIDETPAGEMAVSFATALARGNGSSVHVVHVNLVLLGGRGVTLETYEQAGRVQATAVDHLHAAGVEATGEAFAATSFALATRIARVAAAVDADVVVLGSHRRRRLGRMASRGVRERLSRATSLPVVTAPPPLKLGRHRRPAAELQRLSRSGASSELPR